MGALWDANAKRWYITEHHNPEDFKFWTTCEDDEQQIEVEQESEEEEIAPIVTGKRKRPKAAWGGV